MPLDVDIASQGTTPVAFAVNCPAVGAGVTITTTGPISIRTGIMSRSMESIKRRPRRTPSLSFGRGGPPNDRPHRCRVELCSHRPCLADGDHRAQPARPHRVRGRLHSDDRSDRGEPQPVGNRDRGNLSGDRGRSSTNPNSSRWQSQSRSSVPGGNAHRPGFGSRLMFGGDRSAVRDRDRRRARAGYRRGEFRGELRCVHAGAVGEQCDHRFHNRGICTEHDSLRRSVWPHGIVGLQSVAKLGR